MARVITDAARNLETFTVEVVLWGGSVLALAAVGMFFRLLMTAAGFTS